MNAMNKKDQLKKNRQPNPKRMSNIEKKLYIDFLREESGGICQIPDCNNPAQDWEHPKRGINRDDRETILICRKCHQIADQPSPTQINESREIKSIGKKLAKQNWRNYRE